MQVSANQLAEMMGGEVEGNGDVKVSSPAKIEEAKEGDVTFYANPKYEPYVYTTKASVILVPKGFSPSKKVEATMIRVDDVYRCLADLLEQYGNGMELPRGISSKADVDPSAAVSDDASIGAFTIVSTNVSIGKGSRIYGQVFIGDHAVIGDNVTIYPGVKVYSHVKVGEGSILHSNCVIGCDGFGFAKDDSGAFKKIQQTGNVVLGKNVEIGANTVVDRATMGSTYIHDGVKLDNLIQVAHNVEIGENTAIAAQTGIAGSTKIEENCLIGGQVAVNGHIRIRKGTMVQATSGVSKTTKENAKLYGQPAFEYNQFLRSYASFKNLPDLVRRLHELEEKLKKIEDPEGGNHTS